MKISTPNLTTGFTLIEVIVATAVIAFAMAAVIQTTTGGASNMGYLRDKTFAHWVAMNQLALVQNDEPRPAVGRSKGEAEMAGREWFWSQTVESTEEPQVRRVEIKVRRVEDEKAPNLVTLVGLLDLPVAGGVTLQGGQTPSGQTDPDQQPSGDSDDISNDEQ